MKANNENSLSRSRKQNSTLPFLISDAVCSPSIKGVLHYVGHEGKCWRRDNTNCSQSLPGGSQTLCTLYPHPVRSICHNFHHCPCTPPCRHQVISEVHLPWFAWIPPGQIKSPPLAVTCTFSQSHSCATWMNPGIHSHTYRERLPSFLLHGPVLSQQWPDKLGSCKKD